MTIITIHECGDLKISSPENLNYQKVIQFQAYDRKIGQ